MINKKNIIQILDFLYMIFIVDILIGVLMLIAYALRDGLEVYNKISLYRLLIVFGIPIFLIFLIKYVRKKM